MAGKTITAGDRVAEAHAAYAVAGKALSDARAALDSSTTTAARRKAQTRYDSARSDWNDKRVAVAAAEREQAAVGTNGASSTS